MLYALFVTGCVCLVFGVVYPAVIAVYWMLFRRRKDQFAYNTKFRRKDSVCDGGLSALEYAFGVLLECGCKTNSNGTITRENLWKFMDEHYRKFML